MDLRQSQVFKMLALTPGIQVQAVLLPLAPSGGWYLPGKFLQRRTCSRDIHHLLAADCRELSHFIRHLLSLVGDGVTQFLQIERARLCASLETRDWNHPVKLKTGIAGPLSLLVLP